MGWSRNTPWALVAPLAALLSLLGCGDDAPVTELRVVVHSDLPVPEELAEVRASVGESGSSDATQHSFALSGRGAVPLPLSFSLVPRGGDASRTVALEVEGRSAQGALLVMRRIRTGFVAGKRLSLPVLLLQRCVGVSCDAGMSCEAGRCVDERVEPAELTEIGADEDPRPTLPAPAPDGGSAPDAGALPLDAGSRDDPDADTAPMQDGGDSLDVADGGDAGGGQDPLVDAAQDTLEIDCGATPCACPAQARCELSCTVTGCEMACAGASCQVDAVGRENVQLSCSGGAECVLDARNSRRLAIDCSGGASCQVDCTGSSRCILGCSDGDCALQCSGANNCVIEDCPTDVRECADGTLLCGAGDCP